MGGSQSRGYLWTFFGQKVLLVVNLIASKATTNKNDWVTAIKKIKIKTKKNIQSLTNDWKTECIICAKLLKNIGYNVINVKIARVKKCVNIDLSQPYYYWEAKQRFGHCQLYMSVAICQKNICQHLKTYCKK